VKNGKVGYELRGRGGGENGWGGRWFWGDVFGKGMCLGRGIGLGMEMGYMMTRNVGLARLKKVCQVASL